MSRSVVYLAVKAFEPEREWRTFLRDVDSIIDRNASERMGIPAGSQYQAGATFGFTLDGERVDVTRQMLTSTARLYGVASFAWAETVEL